MSAAGAAYTLGMIDGLPKTQKALEALKAHIAELEAKLAASKNRIDDDCQSMNRIVTRNGELEALLRDARPYVVTGKLSAADNGDETLYVGALLRRIDAALGREGQ